MLITIAHAVAFFSRSARASPLITLSRNYRRHRRRRRVVFASLRALPRRSRARVIRHAQLISIFIIVALRALTTAAPNTTATDAQTTTTTRRVSDVERRALVVSFVSLSECLRACLRHWRNFSTNNIFLISHRLICTICARSNTHTLPQEQAINFFKVSSSSSPSSSTAVGRGGGGGGDSVMDFLSQQQKLQLQQHQMQQVLYMKTSSPNDTIIYNIHVVLFRSPPPSHRSSSASRASNENCRPLPHLPLPRPPPPL